MTKKLSPSELRERRKYTILDFKYLWSYFINHKKRFAQSVLGCLFLAAAYIYFVRPAYNVRARMVIVEKRSSTSSGAAALLQGNLNLPAGLGNINIGVENEKEVLKSRLISRDVVNDLGIHTEYRLQKFLKKQLLYKTQPVNVEASQEMLNMFDEDLPLVEHLVKMTIEKTDEGYEVETMLRWKKKKKEMPAETFKSLPAVVHTMWGDLKLTENTELEPELKKHYDEEDYTLKVTIAPPMSVARQFSKRTSIASVSKKAVYTINLDIADENVVRGIDYLNGIIDSYNDFTNRMKHEEVEKSDNYVNSRLAKIDAELDSADQRWESSKRQYQVTEPEVDAEEVMSKKSSYETQLVNFGIQQQLLDYLSEYVSDPANRYELIPVNVGVYTGDAIAMISRHNQLVTERKMTLKSVTEQSNQVKQHTQLIDELHPVILTAIRRDKEALQLRRRTAEREYNKYASRISNVPAQERVLTEIGRNRNVKQGVFVTLLQKRENNAMELISSTNKGRKIDETLYQNKAKPKTLIIIGLAFVFGMLLPYVWLFVRREMKKDVETEVDLALKTRLPLLGTLSHDRGTVDDEFRKLRINLLHQLKDGRKVILFTSANESDGKTYCASKLSKAFAGMGEKTIICDLNLRHPSVALALGLTGNSSLASLLTDRSVTLEKVMNSIQQTDIEGLFALTTEAAQRMDPADLLAHKSLLQVMTFLRDKFDIILLDCPAVGRYSDILIDGLADLTCYVCRAGKTPKAEIESLDKMANEDRLPSPCIVLNRI